MTVYYEWDVETVATVGTVEIADGDILEHRHQTCFSDALAVAALPAEPGTEHRIVLVRDDDAGRSWAYFSDGELDDRFEDAWARYAAKVPKRFYKEVAKHVTPA